jgi:trans-aconitate 2-methyltransferase
MSAGAGWDWDAEEYARNSAAQLGWARELMAKLRLAGSESVLDIGCGDGRGTAELALSVPSGEVVGIDSSEDMIRKARAAFPAAGNLSFLLMDAGALPFRDRFDVAYSNATLHWVKDHPPVLRGVVRCLHRGGRVLFQMGGRGNGGEIFTLARLMTEEDPWRSFFKGFDFPWGFYGPDEYARWCVESGLRPLRIELLPRDMLQQGARGLAGWIRTTWMPYTARLPQERREGFVREAAERYVAAHPPDENGDVTVKMVRLEVEAEKP